MQGRWRGGAREMEGGAREVEGGIFFFWRQTSSDMSKTK